MSAQIGNSLKIILRNRMKNEVIKVITPESIQKQSDAVTEKILKSEAFRNSKNISIYCSLPSEVSTQQLMLEMFRLDKHVYIPYYKGNKMEMVRIRNLEDYESLPLTKWNIKQPATADGRENALTNGQGIDLFIMPGVAFTLSGGRLGHGMGYYDKYLKRHFDTYSQKKVTLMALALKEQIVDESILPLDPHDVRLNVVITA